MYIYRVPHTYHVNDKVMMRKGTKNKYEVPFNGSHKILKIITNGTVRLRFGFLTDTKKKSYQTLKRNFCSIHGGECNMRPSKKRR
jgi:hypothetical protein